MTPTVALVALVPTDARKPLLVLGPVSDLADPRVTELAADFDVMGWQLPADDATPDELTEALLAAVDGSLASAGRSAEPFVYVGTAGGVEVGRSLMRAHADRLSGVVLGDTVLPLAGASGGVEEQHLGDVHDAGLAVRRAVAGDVWVDHAQAATTDFTRDFQRFITTYAWGSVWTRPGLDRHTRSVITLTALVARGHHQELAMHVRGALTNGLSRAEIGEVLLQCAIYCGVPDANTAFRIASDVFAEIDGSPTS